MISLAHLPVQRIKPVFAWFPFQRTVLDWSGNGTVLTQQNTPHFERRNGVDALVMQNIAPQAYFTAAHAAHLDLANMSVFASGEFKHATNNTLVRKLGTGVRYQVYTNNPTSISMYNGVTASTLVMDVGQLRTFAMTLESTKQPRFFGDGAFAGLGSLAVSLSPTDSTFYLGYPGGEAMQRRTEVFLLYGGVLTDTEVSDLNVWSQNLVSPALSVDRRYFDMGSLVAANAETQPETPDGAEQVVDGNMEAVGVAAWTDANDAILTKETGSPGGTGTQVLRIAFDGIASPYAYQSILTIGRIYRVSGWARGDGVASAPRLYVGLVSSNWLGTTSTAWQKFDIVATADNSSLALLCQGGTGYVEFDDVSVVATDELVSDGDMEATGVAEWTPLNNADLSKETTDPYEGAQVLRIARDGTNNPYCRQQPLIVGIKYHVRARARSDGSAIPLIYCGGAAVSWVGTNSTAWQEADFVAVADGNNLFLQALTSTGTEYAEFDAVSVKPVRETVLAYDVKDVVGRTLPDRTGNGNDGALTGTVTPKRTEFGTALEFFGSAGDSVDPGSLAITNDFAFEAIVNLKSNGGGGAGRLVEWTTTVFLYSPAGTTMSSYLGTITGSPFTMPNTIRYGEWMHIVFTRQQSTGLIKLYVNGEEVYSTTAGTELIELQQAWTLGNRAAGDRALDGSIAMAKQYSRYMEPAEVLRRWQPVRDKLLYEQDFDRVRPTFANLTAGVIPGTDYEVLSGTWAVGEDADGKYIECVVAGRIARPNTHAFGTWEFEVSKDDATTMKVAFLSTVAAATTGYEFRANASESLIVYELIADAVQQTHYSSNAGYIAADTRYRFRITRSIPGAFALYAKGGAFTSWTLLANVAVGTNPFTDTTYVDNSYTAFSFGADDRLYLDRQYFGVVTPT